MLWGTSFPIFGGMTFSLFSLSCCDYFCIIPLSDFHLVILGALFECFPRYNSIAPLYIYIPFEYVMGNMPVWLL